MALGSPKRGNFMNTKQIDPHFAARLGMRLGWSSLRLALAAVSVALSAPACAESIQNWRDGVNYPAHVKSIPFGSGTLSAGSSVRFGAWTISFENGPPVAEYQDSAAMKCTVVRIAELKCSNSVAGAKLCQMWFTVRGCESSGAVGTAACRVNALMVEDRGTMPEFIVPCPASIDLAR